MENVIKVVRDIFSMDFDVIIPVSGSIIAVSYTHLDVYKRQTVCFSFSGSEHFL